MRFARSLAQQARLIAEAGVRAGLPPRRIRRTVERALFAAVSDRLRARLEREVGRRRNP